MIKTNEWKIQYSYGTQFCKYNPARGNNDTMVKLGPRGEIMIFKDNKAWVVIDTWNKKIRRIGKEKEVRI